MRHFNKGLLAFAGIALSVVGWSAIYSSDRSTDPQVQAAIERGLLEAKHFNEFCIPYLVGALGMLVVLMCVGWARKVIRKNRR